jgi:carbon-monoxide dehydrogenase medium subunit
VKPCAFAYHRPPDISGVVDTLERYPDSAKILAGGQSLIPAMNLRMATPPVLVDIAGVPDLGALQVQADGRLQAGAMVTHAAFLRRPDIAQGWPPIVQAVQHVAHLAVRNRGTIGGSLCHADPAAEWPAVCLLLDAQMHVAGRAGIRTVSADAFIQGVYETALQPGELLTQIVFPALSPGWRWGFHEIARRRGDFALAGALAGVCVNELGRVTHGRLVVFAAEDQARRFDDVFSMPPGESLPGLDIDRIDSIGLSVAAQVEPRSDLHADAALRAHLVHACVVQAVGQAVGQAMSQPGVMHG